jgi:hypothetical protein
VSKVIVLEPFSDWHISGDSSPYLARTSDRHEIRIDFERHGLKIHLWFNRAERTINTFESDDMAAAVQFVDKYIDQNYLPAEEASRILRETDAREKSLHLQIAELQAAAIGQA